MKMLLLQVLLQLHYAAIYYIAFSFHYQLLQPTLTFNNTLQSLRVKLQLTSKYLITVDIYYLFLLLLFVSVPLL